MAIYNLLHYNIPVNEDLQFVFDTNIWLFLYSNIHEDREREINAYSKLFEEVIDNDHQIALPGLIISEFTNVLLRADYNLIKDLIGDDKYSFKKDYVKSNYYKNKVNEINYLIEEILNIDNVFKLNDNFENINLEKVKNNFNEIDWNDSFLLEIVKKYNYKLVSNDYDFTKVYNKEKDFDLIILK